MDLRHLRYFLAVAEELNFRRAAEKLGMAQPPLSSQIHDLEDEIGVPLFRRVPKGAELTEAGAAFLSAVPAVFDRLEAAVRIAQRGGRGEVGQLRVGYTGSASFNQIVPRSLREFRRAYPNVELSLEELNSTQLLEQLGRQRLDAAFIRPGDGAPMPGVDVMALDEEPMMVVVPAAHRLAARYAVELAELRDEEFIMFSRALGPGLYDSVVEGCRRAGFEPKVTQVAPQITSIANLVAVELGVSLVPAQVASRSIPGIAFLPIAGTAPVARLSLATRSEDRSVVTRNFRSFVRDVARKAASA
ncbi:LysR family transcriptional regulator [Acidimangrovimonas sediminis]|uniref:LysR family transcriptional regulator n=1 Tax=Acidimangrovimonas sediminis TaxID=2056283 RepID=UPI000C7F7F2B|nr:LysR family transcriptional regulator [Acidimangrovimonas sediminis]